MNQLVRICPAILSSLTPGHPIEALEATDAMLEAATLRRASFLRQLGLEAVDVGLNADPISFGSRRLRVIAFQLCCAHLPISLLPIKW